MKKLLLITTVSIVFFSCSNDEPNCECDKVVSTDYFSIGMPGGGTVQGGSFSTVNECTNETRSWPVAQYGQPSIGDCR